MSALSLVDALLRDAAALLLIKVTAVLVLASGVAFLAAGLSAARRHALWLVALATCVGLALSSPVVPTVLIHAPQFAKDKGPTTSSVTVGAHAHSGAGRIASAFRLPRPSTSTQSPSRPPVGSLPLPAHPLLAIWIIGCVLLLTRDAIGWSRAIQLGRHAVIADDRDTRRELEGAVASIGSRREIVVAYSVELQSPIAFGIVKPIVLLPIAARSWPTTRRRAVLVHEAAHVARRDSLSQIIGRIACAMFWFHPLVWRAFAHLRYDAERAADDCVLRAGIPALEYASHLLDLARRATDESLGLIAVGIGTTTHLERRFLSMFDDTRSRASVTARAQAATMACALFIVGPLASLRVGAPVAQSRGALQQQARTRSAVATRTAIAERRPSQTRPVATFAAMNVRAQAIESPMPMIAVIASGAPRMGAHPDFSGRWTSDTTSIRSPEIDNIVLDSLIVRQTDDAISLESRGHIVTPTSRIVQTHNLFSNITFDGAPCGGFTVTGNAVATVVTDAVWAGDTLIITSHSRGDSGKNFHTIERLTLSSDGQTFVATNRSFVDGKDRWGGVKTFTFRRMAR